MAKQSAFVPLLLIAVFGVALAAIGIISLRRRRPRRAVAAAGGAPPAQGSCGAASTCGATDPVSDPAYNMVQIAKQSILLEEHLVEPAKHCDDCIAKHFLAIIGLAEEAVMLACTRVDAYPLLASSPAFYEGLFAQWREDRHGEANQQRIAEALRARRKQIVAIYILGSESEA